MSILILITVLLNCDNRRLKFKEKTVFTSAMNGDLVSLNQLIANKADANATKHGFTPLMLAARNGHLAIVDRLLVLKEVVDNVNLANNKGNTALIQAAMNGHERVVERLLLVKGINFNHRNNNGNTALNKAIKHGHNGIVTKLKAIKAAN